MPLLVTHTTAADGTFSSAGATAWNATHAIAGTLDLATETTGSLDLAARTTGSLDLLTRSTGTIDLLTQTRGATANQLMYGGASGQVAQSSGMAWDAANSLLTVTNKVRVGDAQVYSSGLEKVANTVSALIIRGAEVVAPATGNGGGVSVFGRDARTSGDGGTIEFTSGNGAGATGSAGTIQLTGGNSSASGTDGNGGSVIFLGGETFKSNGYGGDAIIQAGNASPASNGFGGSVLLQAGNVINTTGTPGSVSLLVGENNSGVVGSFVFGASVGAPVAVTAGTGTTHAADFPVIVDGVQYYIQLYS